ncbi:MAG: hypothetical protein K8I00_01515, partial [Candidatus Omnitrophica bacterium]|nr:hypothetical protein [Candidatus Omnitrophota bacterium]
STPATVSHTTTLTTDTTYLVSLRAVNGANNGVDLRLNGDEDTDGTFDMITLGAEVGVGSDQSTVATDPYDGEIAEIIVYSNNLVDLDMRRVESYLALKYGITLDQTAATSYLSSNCTTVACSGGGEVMMWDSGATGASTYDQDIAGIGADINSDLNQLKSHSVNTDGLVTISAASDQDDLEFLSWGNDDGSLTTSSSEVPGALPGSATDRLTREWLAQNNGGDGVGTVTVAFDLSQQSALDRNATAGNYALLIDDDGDFSDATVHTTGATKSGANITFSTADIRAAGDGLYFSLAGPAFTNPGGVSTNLEFWVKANAGVYTNTGCTTVAADTNSVACWQDQSLQGNNVTEGTAVDQPALDLVAADSDFNFFPSLDFDGSDQLTRSTLLAGGDDITVLVVAQDDSLSGTDTAVGFGVDGDDPGLQTFGSTLQTINDASTPATFTHSASLSEFTTYLMVFKASNGTNNGVDLRLNGEQETEATFDMLTIGTEFGIGADYNDPTNEAFDGEIGEVIVYSSNLSGVDWQKVESYLSLKYGIEINQTSATSYLSSNCTTAACNGVGEVMMWDSGASQASTYDNDIIGIGRDDASGLGVVKSRSANPDGITTLEAVGEGSNVAPSWVDIADLEFLTWGNNDVGAAWTSTDAPSNYKILTREWLPQEPNGDVGLVNITFDVDDTDFNIPGLLEGVNYYIVVDSDKDGNFSDQIPLALTNVSGSLWRVANYNLADGEKFTLATESTVIPPATGPKTGAVIWID